MNTVILRYVLTICETGVVVQSAHIITVLPKRNGLHLLSTSMERVGMIIHKWANILVIPGTKGFLSVMRKMRTALNTVRLNRSLETT